MFSKFRFLLLGIMLPAIGAWGAKDVSVAQFGAVPDDGKNDAEALRAAAQYCREHAGTTLVFPAGVYDFSDPMAADIERRAINGELGRGLEVQWNLFTPQKPYVTGLDFTGCKRLHIRAHGAVLNVEGWMEVMSFVKAANVTVEGLTITYKRPAATEGTVVATSPDSYDIAFDPNLYKYIDNIVQGRLYFYSQTKKRFYYGGADEMTLLRPGLVRMRSKLNPPLGDVCIIRYGGHYRPCIMLKQSKNMTMKDVTILSFPGMGVVGHMTENIMVDGLKVVPAPRRYSSTNTDATHFTSCSGTITIQNSTFKGNGDDCTNIHNYYYHLYPDEHNVRKVELRIEGADLHAQSLDFPEIGDTLWLVNNRNFVEEGRYVVKNVHVSEKDWKVVVTLDNPLRLTDPKSSFMVNHTRFPEVRILNNTVFYHNGRAFLLKVPHCVVKGNSIQNCTLTAIKLGAELSWHEAGPVESAVVENNYIAHCGEEGGSQTASCVMVTTEARETPPYVNRNIWIRNNVFDSGQACAILLQDAENVDIRNNIVGQQDYVRQNNCRNVKIEGK